MWTQVPAWATVSQNRPEYPVSLTKTAQPVLTIAQ